MATTSYGVGCKNIKTGPVGVDGAMGAALTSVGKLYKNTVSIVDEDGTVTKHTAEGDRYPFLNVLDAAGTVIKFTLTDIAPANMALWLGGSVAVNVWKAANASFSTEQSWSADTLFGTTIKVPRLFMHCKLTWNMTRTEIAKMEVTGEVMTPDKVDEAPISIAPTV